MDKYLKKYKKLKKPYKLSIVFIGLSAILLLFLVFLVLFPILNISENDLNAVSSDKELDRIIIINNILSVAIIISSFMALIFAVIGKSRDKRKSKK
jgi:uncharacterized BrkB/YihY/UPF0761 family membrane protein